MVVVGLSYVNTNNTSIHLPFGISRPDFWILFSNTPTLRFSHNVPQPFVIVSFSLRGKRCFQCFSAFSLFVSSFPQPFFPRVNAILSLTNKMIFSFKNLCYSVTLLRLAVRLYTCFFFSTSDRVLSNHHRLLHFFANFLCLYPLLNVLFSVTPCYWKS